MSNSLADIVKENRRIIVAVMLRDMKTRFGGNYFSYLITVGWPFAHLLLLYSMYVVVNSVAPIGDDPAIFVVTGIAPYILCVYPARWVAVAILMNKPLLQFPTVKPIHLIISRIILELITSYIVFILFMTVLILSGHALVPYDKLTVMTTISMSIYFGVSLGAFGAVLSSIIGMAAMFVVIGTMLVLYATSGAFMPSIYLAESTRDMLWWGPLYHCVGLFRSAYYASYGSDYFSSAYIFLVSSLLILISVAGERMVRGKLLSS